MTEVAERHASPLGVSGATFTAVGLQLDEGLSFSRWQEIGDTISQIHKATTWFVGDWVVQGEQKFGDAAAQATEALGLAYATIADAAWVCRRIELSRRREELSYTHHKEVARLEDPIDQDHWLGQAIENKWSTRELRAAVQEAAKPGDGNKPGKGLQFLKMPGEDVDLEQLKDAAVSVWHQAQKDGDRYLVPLEPMARLAAALGVE